jgi:hypothetical protein
LILVGGVNAYFQKNFWKEMKDSFKVPKDDKPLGEIKIAEYIKAKKSRSKK